MPLTEHYPNSVVFIVANRTNRTTGMTVPTTVGTGFLVGVPAGQADRSYLYAVTAKHCIEDETETWIRIRLKQGGVRDQPVLHWTLHPYDDVAVAQLWIPDDMKVNKIPIAHGLDVSDRQPNLGDRVYFVGMLALLSKMRDENVPMVRSGTLGRLYQDDVPLEHADGHRSYHTNHLIDCRSYGGFSGSPCFVQMESIDMAGNGVAFTVHTLLLGLISGHLDDTQQSVRINTGVGVVVPVEKIRECLMDDELVAQRKAYDAITKAEEQAQDGAATPDNVEDAPFTQSDFESALRKVSRRTKPSRPDEGTSGTSE